MERRCDTPIPDLLVLMQPNLQASDKESHHTYLKDQNIDQGMTKQKYHIGSFNAYAFTSEKATEQLAQTLDRPNTPSLRKKVVQLLEADSAVQGVEENQTMHTQS